MRHFSPAALMRQWGASYYLATQFFPRQTRMAVYTLYRFVRLPDQVIDTPGVSPTKARAELENMRQHRTEVYDEKNFTDPKRWHEARLFHEYDIPFEYSKDFRAAMLQDTHKTHYDTYPDLQHYMYGSAEVVGLMMGCVLGMDEQGVPHAKALGEAMQYTNFLRDVLEDYKDFWRVYMPADRLAEYGLTPQDVKAFCAGRPIDDRRRAFMEGQITSCDILYKKAYAGLKHLPPHARRAVLVAGKLYQGILTKIRRIDYDVFTQSARTEGPQKTAILFSALYHSYAQRFFG